MDKQIQYIGARYVIKVYENTLDHSAEWQEHVDYEPLVLVTYNLGTYLTRKYTPASVGNPVDNPEYWVRTGYYNGQIAYLQEEIDRINNALNGETNERKSADLALRSSISNIGGNLTTETTARINADAALREDLNSEIANRQGADATLQTGINNVNLALSDEASLRTNADANLQAQIDEFVAPTGEAPNPTEITNARVGANGITYDSLGNAIRGQVGELGYAINDSADYQRLFVGVMETGTATINAAGTEISYNDDPNFQNVCVRTKRDTTISLKAGDIIINNGRLRIIRKVNDSSYIYPTGSNTYITTNYVVTTDGDYYLVATKNPESTFTNMGEVLSLISIFKKESFIAGLIDDVNDKTDVNSGDIYDVVMQTPANFTFVQGSAFKTSGTNVIQYMEANTRCRLVVESLDTFYKLKWKFGFKVAVYITVKNSSNQDVSVYDTNSGFLPASVTELVVPKQYRKYNAVIVIAKLDDSVITTSEANSAIKFTNTSMDKFSNLSNGGSEYLSRGYLGKINGIKYDVNAGIEYTHDTIQTNQSLAIWGDKIYQCTSNDKIVVYDLGTASIEATYNVTLGHANACQFSDEYYDGNTIPLLYVCDHYSPIIYGVNITNEGAEVVKTYTLHLVDETLYNFSGCYDSVNKKFITISTHLNDSLIRVDNWMTVKIWDMTSATLESGINYAVEKAKEYDIPFIFCMQDCKFINGIAYIISSADSNYAQQYGENSTWIYALDVYKEVITGIIKDFPTTIANYEVEGMDVYDGKLLCNPLSGYSFTIEW